MVDLELARCSLAAGARTTNAFAWYPDVDRFAPAERADGVLKYVEATFEEEEARYEGRASKQTFKTDKAAMRG